MIKTCGAGNMHLWTNQLHLENQRQPEADPASGCPFDLTRLATFKASNSPSDSLGQSSKNFLRMTDPSLRLSASYIVRSMRVLSIMENLLAIEAEAKVFLSASDRSHEQTLMQELLRILKEAELLFGPRDASYQLSIPRLTECTSSRSFIFRPLRMTRVYLSRESRTKPWVASLELAHEAIHVLSPGGFGSGPTILEEGLAETFAQRYVNRVYGLTFERGADPKADAVMRAVSTLLAKNQFVIKQLRTRQPVISKIDENLLIEVAGVERSQAKFLCTDFKRYWRT